MPRVLVFLALGLLGAAAAQGQRLPHYEFTVRDGWMDAPKATKDKVLRCAADELLQYFPERKFRPIAAQYRSDGPYIFYEGSQKPPYHHTDVLVLSATSTFWCQYLYQFSHELCHLLHNADQPYPHEVSWFNESLSEMASLFVLRSLAVKWTTAPLYRGWESYAPNLYKYADNVMRGRFLPFHQTLAQWYAAHREELRQNGTNRRLNAIVAAELLPLFEQYPHRWESLTWMGLRRESLRQKKLTFEEFLAEWRFHCPPEHQAFVSEIAEKFGVRVPFNQPEDRRRLAFDDETARAFLSGSQE